MREGRDAQDAERWVERTRELDQDIADAWAVFRQARESGRLNLRRAAAARVDASHALVPLLARLEQAVADTRSMAGTIGRAAAPAATGIPASATQWLDLVARAGAAVSEADVHAITRVREDLESMARGLFAAGGDTTPRPVHGALIVRFFHADAASTPRPAHGALIVNLRNILEAMDAVAEAQPVRVQARPAVAMSGRPKSIA